MGNRYAAQLAGLRAGDVIIAVNDVPVQDVATFNRLVERTPGRIVALLVRRGASTRYAPIPLR